MLTPSPWLARALLALALLVALFTVPSCQAKDEVRGAVVTAACARCQFHMVDTPDCPWAVEIEGKRYLVQGPVPEDHSKHSPDGICNMPREAVVDGRIKDDRFIATRLELLPAKNVPATPQFKPDESH